MIYKRKMKVIERWHLRSGKLVNYPEKFRKGLEAKLDHFFKVVVEFDKMKKRDK
jgi:hypothetical protein